MNLLLKPVELIYRGINRLRRFLYRRGVLRARHLPRPVISIGNIAVGGSGKTPLVITAAEILVRSGFKVAVLTRGYGRSEGRGIAIVDSPDASRFGDEPVLLASRLPGVDVVVGADRWRAGRWYLDRKDADIFLLDDGFQHLQLARDLDVVIHQKGDGWLREGPSALRHAGLVVSRDEGASVHARLVPAAVIIDGEERRPDSLRGVQVVAFAGLARNDQFFRLLESLGARLAARVPFPDHHPYSGEELARLETLRRESGASLLVTTEKDFARIQRQEIAWLRVHLDVDRAFEEAIVGVAQQATRKRERSE